MLKILAIEKHTSVLIFFCLLLSESYYAEVVLFWEDVIITFSSTTQTSILLVEPISAILFVMCIKT